MRKRERKPRTEMDAAQEGVRFGIAPKMLLSILIPLFAVLLIMGLFLGNQVSGTVDQVMSGQLDASSQAAANQVEAFFERYYGIAECLAAT